MKRVFILITGLLLMLAAVSMAQAYGGVAPGGAAPGQPPAADWFPPIKLYPPPAINQYPLYSPSRPADGGDYVPDDEPDQAPDTAVQAPRIR
jgi:hypothetical protein